MSGWLPHKLAKRVDAALRTNLIGVGNNGSDVGGKLQSSNDRTSNHTPYITNPPTIKPPINPTQSIIRPLRPSYTASPRVDIGARL